MGEPLIDGLGEVGGSAVVEGVKKQFLQRFGAKGVVVRPIEGVVVIDQEGARSSAAEQMQVRIRFILGCFFFCWYNNAGVRLLLWEG